MTDPAAQDDSWDELARELGLEKSAPAGRAAPPEPAPAPEPTEDEPEPAADEPPARGHRHPAEQATLFDAEPERGESDDEGDEGDDAEGDAAEGEAAAGDGTGEDGQPGTGRKRRRRRRRRKKGGPAVPGAPGEAAAAEGDEPEEPVGSYSAAGARAVAVREEPEPVAEADDEAETSGASPLAAEEDTGGEVLRELIATWNVPAWDEIVSGLYRPER